MVSGERDEPSGGDIAESKTASHQLPNETSPFQYEDDELSSRSVILYCSPSIMVKARRERKSREKNETFFANLFSFQTSRNKVKP